MDENVVPPECDKVRAEKHRERGEGRREACNRIAAALQDCHESYMASREMLMEDRFLPGGRIQAGAGSLRSVTLYNCFVMGTIHDSFTHGPSGEELARLGAHEHPPVSICQTQSNAAQTMRQGGGVGYDFSTLRPSGDVIRGVQSDTDGPLAFMPIFDATCQATSSAGNRRGAQMATLRIDHPDVEAFIRAKQVEDRSIPHNLRPLRGFNMSLMITDEFMECLNADRPFPLKFKGEVYREVDPNNLWEMAMRGTYDWAEPGVVFIDQVNRMNNLHYCETISSTNPCGEQPLPPYGACLLGSINLPRYLYRYSDGTIGFDQELLGRDIPILHRMMDNVVDRSQYPLAEQKAEARNKRRMGIGITGLANALECLGLPYGSPEFCAMQDHLQLFIARELYLASANLAEEKGSFPLFDKKQFLRSKFVQTLGEDVAEAISRKGIRNSHLTSIAPTGTISFGAGNVSSGIEPIFGEWNARRVRSIGGEEVVEVQDYAARVHGVVGKFAEEVTPNEHVRVLTTAQKRVDSAVSKTCNLPADISWEDFKDVYLKAYEGGAKGCTTYRPNGAYQDVVKKVDRTDEDQQACGFDPLTGQKTGPCAED